VKVLTAIALAIATMPLFGVVLRSLWAWFVVPLGVPPIGIAHAVGLSVVVAVFKSIRVDDDDETGPVVKAIIVAVVLMVLWGMGWAVHLVMVAP